VAPGRNVLWLPLVTAPLAGPGSAAFDLWSHDVTESSLTVQRLSPTISEAFTVSSLAGDDRPGVRFVGGWTCTYAIRERSFSCVNDMEPSESFSIEGSPDTNKSLPYSGYYGIGDADATCTNNPCAQCATNLGPIPEGEYGIGAGYMDPYRPGISYALTPIRERCWGEDVKHGRDSLLIHFGDSAPSNWSTGCLVVPDPTKRSLLNKYGGGLLVVSSSEVAGFNLNEYCCVKTTKLGANLSSTQTGKKCGSVVGVECRQP
jgi:hypothetical protein